MWVDTHTHLYLKEFERDYHSVIKESIELGITEMYFPNIDETTILPLLNITKHYPDNCFPMIGLHPGSVKADFEDKLSVVENWLEKEKFYGIGEIGIDLYWDKTYRKEQMQAFEYQLMLSKKKHLPAIIHIREAFNEVFSVIEKVWDKDLFGIFHCFTGTEQQAKRAIEMGFVLGIGGVVTFKKSHLPEVLKSISLSDIVLETDSPYLAPVPFRGQRNKTTYIPFIGKHIAEIKNCSVYEVAKATTENASKIFKQKK